MTLTRAYVLREKSLIFTHVPGRSTMAERSVDRRDANSALARATRTDPALCSATQIFTTFAFSAVYNCVRE